MIWDGAVKGGGVNGYCQSLALELVERGHEVVYLSGGLTYTPVTVVRTEGVATVAAGTRPGPCEVRRHPDWLGVKVFEVLNSPVVAPSIHQFGEPDGEIDSPELVGVVGEFFRELAPDIVHFHNIEGFTASCVRAAKVRGQDGNPTRVFYSLHNYHTLCPQVYLMQGHRRPCRDYRNGNACEGCIESTPPSQERARRLAEFVRGLPVEVRPAVHAEAHADEPKGPPVAEAGAGVAAGAAEGSPTVLRQLGAELKSLMFGTHGPASHAWAAGTAASPEVPREPRALELPAPLPGVELSSGGLTSAMPIAGADARGQTGFILAERTQARKLGPSDPEWAALDNDASADPPGEAAPNAYARRRAAMVAMLNGCDGVLAVSEFVRRKFENTGVRPGVIRTNHIGTRLNRVVKMHRDVIFDPPPFARESPRPVRLVFIGFNNWYKGLPMLADSLELMRPEELSRLHLYIYGLGVGADEWRFRRMEPRLGGLVVHPMYAYYDVPWILGGKDLGVVPSVWWDNAPQTVFEFFACGVPVLGADLGGIPDFVTEGHNGMLFKGNDRYDLARRLGEIVRDPSRLFELRRNVRPPKDIGDHAVEMERLYAGGLGALDGGGDPRPQLAAVGDRCR